MGFVFRIIFSGVALLVLDYFMDSIVVKSFWVALLAVVVLSIVNTIIKPILHILALPITFLTLGLFSLVINGATFYLTAWLVDGFDVTSFWGAILGAIFMSIVSVFTTKK